MVGWRLGIALTLALAPCLMGLSPASAQDLAEFFQINYDPVSFDKSEVNCGEVFFATIAGRATCAKDLPALISEACITSYVVAEHAVSGNTVTLNSSYLITIDPFPSKKDEIAEINQVIPLRFPAQAEAGDYTIIGKILEAKVKVGFLWPNVTDYLPQSRTMGSVKYTALEETTSPTPVSVKLRTPNATPLATTTPTKTSTPAPSQTPAPAPTESAIPAWVELTVMGAVVITVLNIVWFWRQRPKQPPQI